MEKWAKPDGAASRKKGWNVLSTFFTTLTQTPHRHTKCLHTRVKYAGIGSSTLAYLLLLTKFNREVMCDGVKWRKPNNTHTHTYNQPALLTLWPNYIFLLPFESVWAYDKTTLRLYDCEFDSILSHYWVLLPVVYANMFSFSATESPVGTAKTQLIYSVSLLYPVRSPPPKKVNHFVLDAKRSFSDFGATSANSFNQPTC